MPDTKALTVFILVMIGVAGVLSLVGVDPDVILKLIRGR